MANENLQGKKVAILVTDGFEQVELLQPREALDKAGDTRRALDLALSSGDFYRDDALMRMVELRISRRNFAAALELTEKLTDPSQRYLVHDLFLLEGCVRVASL